MKKDKSQKQPDRKNRGSKPNEQESINKTKHKPDIEPVARKGEGIANDKERRGEEQTEGEKRIEPYKNIGDDSEEVERKTPSMD